MAMTINTNIGALNAQRQLNVSGDSLKTSMERLSSGLRVNSAKDDAAGLAIGNRMNSQIRGMNVAVRNANDGISLAQTAEAAMGNMTDMLQRMRDLAVQSANTGVVSGSDKNKLSDEFKELGKELARTIQNTSFNGKKILNGSLDAGASFQVGFSTAADNKITVSIASMGAMSGVASVMSGGNISIGSGGDPSAAINAIDVAIQAIDSSRSKLGAAQNRLTATISNLQSSIENNAAAKSRIMDADFATETANLSRAQILQQAGTAMLSQANQSSQGVLKLLG